MPEGLVSGANLIGSAADYGILSIVCGTSWVEFLILLAAQLLCFGNAANLVPNMSRNRISLQLPQARMKRRGQVNVRGNVNLVMSEDLTMLLLGDKSTNFGRLLRLVLGVCALMPLVIVLDHAICATVYPFKSMHKHRSSQ